MISSTQHLQTSDEAPRARPLALIYVSYLIWPCYVHITGSETMVNPLHDEGGGTSLERPQL